MAIIGAASSSIATKITMFSILRAPALAEISAIFCAPAVWVFFGPPPCSDVWFPMSPRLCLAALAAAAAVCPEPASLRAPSVLDAAFNASRLEGDWYENAYFDPAQAGATCPTFSNARARGGGLRQRFACRYGRVPFGIVYELAPTPDAGVFAKHVPGTGWLLTLPTTVVDARARAGAAAGAPYALVTEYACVVEAGVTVEEFRVSSRGATVDAPTLEDALATARAAGVPNATIAKAVVVDFGDC